MGMIQVKYLADSFNYLINLQQCGEKNIYYVYFTFQTVDDFDTRMRAVLRSKPRYAAGVDKGIMPEGYLEAPLAYDAIWALSLGKENN